MIKRMQTQHRNLHSLARTYVAVGLAVDELLLDDLCDELERGLDPPDMVLLLCLSVASLAQVAAIGNVNV